MARLAGKVALISGVGGGQGRVAALTFAREGAVVYGCDINGDGAMETERMVKSESGRMTASVVDLENRDAAKDWIDNAARKEDGFDILYNNAAFTEMAFIEEMSWEQWRRAISGDLDLVFTQCQFAWPYLRTRGNSSIVNIASVQGLMGTAWLGGIGHSAGKGAVISITRQLAVEGGSHGIRVNSISPGFIMTDAIKKFFFESKEFKQKNPKFEEFMRDCHVVKRFGIPEDVVNCALFLASDESTYITGANFVVDGGMTIK